MNHVLTEKINIVDLDERIPMNPTWLQKVRQFFSDLLLYFEIKKSEWDFRHGRYYEFKSTEDLLKHK